MTLTSFFYIVNESFLVTITITSIKLNISIIFALNYTFQLYWY
uniref:Uncharacterized protein n=1 Tax=Klebsiella pneumoniae TaxID=573 RepID=A0A8B0SVF0_KLEPN|nr:hypothetical protein [Klebsiella pneumoniae]